MTRDRDFKDLVRARMSKTGEAYTAARSQLTKPHRGERFEKGAAADGTVVFGMFTKLQTPEKGWSGLAVPSDYLGRRNRAWLRGTINGHEFWVSAQPMGDGNHWVTVNRQMRAAMGLVGDEEVEVRFVIADGPPALEVPPDLLAALGKVPGAKAAFDHLSHNHRKEYLLWIAEAKRDETRTRRIADTIRRLTDASAPRTP
jgi:hypothetical protein